jgi:hypothetical protein
MLNRRSISAGAALATVWIALAGVPALAFQVPATTDLTECSPENAPVHRMLSQFDRRSRPIAPAAVTALLDKSVPDTPAGTSLPASGGGTSGVAN